MEHFTWPDVAMAAVVLLGAIGAILAWGKFAQMADFSMPKPPKRRRASRPEAPTWSCSWRVQDHWRRTATSPTDAAPSTAPEVEA